MTDNAIPSPIMQATARALRDAQDWADDTASAGHQRPGALAVAADLVDRLNAEGYVVARAGAIQALWHENEHLKQRLTEQAANLGRCCGCGQLNLGSASVLDSNADELHRWDGPCHYQG